MTFVTYELSRWRIKDIKELNNRWMSFGRKHNELQNIAVEILGLLTCYLCWIMWTYGIGHPWIYRTYEKATDYCSQQLRIILKWTAIYVLWTNIELFRYITELVWNFIIVEFFSNVKLNNLPTKVKRTTKVQRSFIAGASRISSYNYYSTVVVVVAIVFAVWVLL